MPIMDQLLADLRREEGWSAEPYRDSKGILTIGYGFVIDEDRAAQLPRRVGDLWLEIAAVQRWDALLDACPWLIEQPEDIQRALAQMAYQMGPTSVVGFKEMLAALKRGDRREAARCALDSVWHREDTPARAERVAALIRGHDDPSHIV